MTKKTKNTYKQIERSYQMQYGTKERERQYKREKNKRKA